MMKTCCIDGCDKPHLARSYCAKHYRRFKLYGDPEGGSPYRDGAPKNFFDMATSYSGDNCLMWPYALTSHGYPSAGWDGEIYKVHRLLCETVHGPAPSLQHEVAHNCGVRRCLNPAHVRWATHAENMADTRLHGTTPSGERSGRAVLTWDVVRCMRADFKSGLTQSQISTKYQVRFNAVHKIIHNQRWIE